MGYLKNLKVVYIREDSVFTFEHSAIRIFLTLMYLDLENYGFYRELLLKKVLLYPVELFLHFKRYFLNTETETKGTTYSESTE